MPPPRGGELEGEEASNWATIGNPPEEMWYISLGEAAVFHRPRDYIG